MRIVSGKYKGRRISPPNNITARPTTDFAKEGLFNLLSNQLDFEDINALDLFAGTGSISLELISRECKSVTAVELNEKHYAFIKKTCSELKVDNLLLLKTDVFKFIKKTHAKYDLIFADPPYDLRELTAIPDMIFERDILSENGLFVLEHSAKNNFESHPNFKEHRHYGNVNFSFFRK
ncbi:16S rRNA (guanine(966)-N(2))-methyltransferase RsmD [Paludibacter sp. 221]|uniref:16S rRNA (guanine(966)-N(2))-methyltransferase RsmD n=1 Tax=Paludibacter sp. 221 TaxID=2302939 RepID=UPI0013D2A602|nr:16S rRNA (guanine(966)-N(2))-methyltransferase RsmD [Paludibacter sp. 221]NDV46162.1 16S rRNA (guanine(966)-N(2))-methyltransferase RsmD [Paludibacter sp. 221]